MCVFKSRHHTLKKTYDTYLSFPQGDFRISERTRSLLGAMGSKNPSCLHTDTSGEYDVILILLSCSKISDIIVLGIFVQLNGVCLFVWDYVGWYLHIPGWNREASSTQVAEITGQWDLFFFYSQWLCYGAQVESSWVKGLTHVGQCVSKIEIHLSILFFTQIFRNSCWDT